MDSIQGPPDALTRQPVVSGLTMPSGGEARGGGSGAAHFGVFDSEPCQGELLLLAVQAWGVKVRSLTFLLPLPFPPSLPNPAWLEDNVQTAC